MGSGLVALHVAGDDRGVEQDTQPQADGNPGGRRLAAPLRPDDTGTADERYAAAVASYAQDPAAYVDVLASLGSTRLLVPVVALLGESEVGAGGLVTDKSSDMASVLLTGADGRTALLAFSSTETLQAWDPAGRPVPATVQHAAQAALQDGAAALVVDVAGPTTVVVEGDDLLAVARGWTLSRVGGRWAWIGEEDAPEGGGAGIGQPPE